MRLLLTDDEFTRLRDLLAELAGLVFDGSRRESLSYSVAERLAATGLPDAAAYVSLVEQSGPVALTERQALLDEVTIQETHFFRNPPQIRALRRHVLPELVRTAAAGGRRLRIWSAGCSTGEEAYTLAMLVRELLPDLAGWDVKIVATDLSEGALAAGRAGRYSGRSLQMAEPADLARWFVRDGDGYVVRPDARRLVEFRRHNLVTDAVPFGTGDQVDLVLCRNVTIYFDKDTTKALMQRLHGSLADGGYLFLGHAETLWQVTDAFRLVSLGDAFVYRRDDT
ncbi:MAG: protein-glutamate O-methyltransferase CheR, partial [Actinomycetota bacterium]|nr:protein-glutamate O-methyltransferase CheR [Actinomycetota bacterium]